MKLTEEGRIKARDTIGFISNLTHTEGRQFAGKSFQLLLWQKKLLIKLFGTLRPDGYRQYRTCYVEIAKKNGKSELGAAIALKLLCADAEIGAEVYSVASDKEQAGIVFRKAAQMVRNDPDLNKRLKIIDSQKRIVDYQSQSFYRVLSSDVKAKHGYNPHGVIFDELHTQPNRELWDVLTVGTDAARKQQLVFVMTTAGYDRHSICREVHDYAIKVRDGAPGFLGDPRFLPIIYAVDENEDWKDEKNWRNANPSLGKIFDIENLRSEFKEAKEIPAKENEFRRLRLNQWTSQQTRWLTLDSWDACGGRIELESLKGRICYGGLDLATTTDIAAYLLVFPPENGEAYILVPFFFVPEDTVQKRSSKERIPYNIWAKQGFIIPTPGNVIDYNFIKAKMKETAEKYDLREVAYDRWGAAALVTDMTEEGLTMFPIGMGFSSMSAPTKELEKLILSQKINHGNNPVLRWMFENVMMKTDPAGNIKPDKEKSKDKIDGIVATIIALDRALRNPISTSIYDKQGIFFLDKIEEEIKEEEEN